MTTTINTVFKPLDEETLVQQLNWRYATKRFDPTRRISDRDWAALEEALVLTPSSYGLQPWKFIVVTDPAVREKLKAASWGQQQVVDASHLVVFAVRKGLDAAHVQKYIDRIAEVRHVPVESLDGFKKLLLGAIAGKDPESLEQWNARQTYIALGSFMTAAAVLGIDTCPMEGIEAAKYDRILNLGDDYAAVAACPAGYRASDDKYARLPKVRFNREDVIQRID